MDEKQKIEGIIGSTNEIIIDIDRTISKSLDRYAARLESYHK